MLKRKGIYHNDNKTSEGWKGVPDQTAVRVEESSSQLAADLQAGVTREIKAQGSSFQTFAFRRRSTRWDRRGAQREARVRGGPVLRARKQRSKEKSVLSTLEPKSHKWRFLKQQWLVAKYLLPYHHALLTSDGGGGMWPAAGAAERVALRQAKSNRSKKMSISSACMPMPQAITRSGALSTEE